jgi:hypothetical protein
VALTLFLPAISKAEIEGMPCNPEPTDMNIAYGDLITCSIDQAGDSDTFRFFGTTGEVIVLQGTVQSGPIRPCIELIAPDNSREVACSSSGIHRIDTTLNQTGTFTILLRDYSSSYGEYALALQCLIGCVVLPPFCEGDFDGDHDVDGIDLDVFVEDFGRENCP